MELNLKDKVALVAASSKGLGFGIAGQLANEGVKVSLGSPTHHEVDAAAAKIRDQ